MEAVGRAVSNCLRSGQDIQALPLPEEYLPQVVLAFKFNRLRVACILCVTKHQYLVEFALAAGTDDYYEVIRAVQCPEQVSEVCKFVTSAGNWHSVLRSGSSCLVYVDTPKGFHLKQVDNTPMLFFLCN